ncbi:MAG: hypothetical protein KZQ96_23650 [Candidatus Thiodiazotropha sp. (ex Lucinoma borealis)]|nr:hypothetical protein [Candidatus Thiodiazotropha sp. (ex Lucinoma borealis)]
MGSKLSPKDNALYKSTDEVLHYIWDPIGVAGSPYARDEYYGYLPQVFKMIINKDKTETIVNYLVSVEEKTMGLSPNKEGAIEVVEILKEYKDKYDEEYP